MSANVTIAVVGGCAAGKSSLVERLRRRGIRAWAVAQEHSAIAELWRHQHPDRLVVLEASLETVRRRRRDPVWPGWIWDLQQSRIDNARQHADVVVVTDTLMPDEVAERVARHLGLF